MSTAVLCRQVPEIATKLDQTDPVTVAQVVLSDRRCRPYCRVHHRGTAVDAARDAGIAGDVEHQDHGGVAV